jgi:glycosyltransferase involved in cell wall biosynthesis
MRIGIFLPIAPETVGGGYTFEQELFEQALEYASTSSHEFVVFEVGSSSVANKFPNFRHVSVESALSAQHAQAGAPALKTGYQWKTKCIADILMREGIEFFLNTSPEIAVLEIPYLAIVWDLQHRLQPYFPEVGFGNIWQIRENFFSNVLKRAAFVVTGTQAGKNEIHLFYGIPDERIRILPHPTPRFALEARPANVAQLEKYKLPRDYIFYPAQFWSHKNHVGLLHALVRLKETDNLRLPVVFTGSDRGNEDYARQTVRTLGLEEQVHFLGHVPRETLVALYQNAFVLCYPSFFGPENLPPLEAFALGCPVIAADVPGAREQLGDAATLVNPANEVEIAQALKSLLLDKTKREELIRRGKERARRFTGSDFAKGLFALLDEFQPIRRCWSAEPQAGSGSAPMDDDQDLEAKEKVIQDQKRNLEAKEAVIQAQNREWEAKEAAIQAQKNDLQAKENVIQAQNGELRAREEILQKFRKSYLFWFSDGPLRRIPGVRRIANRLQSFQSNS